MTANLRVVDLGRQPFHIMYSTTASMLIQNFQEVDFIIVAFLKIFKFLC